MTDCGEIMIGCINLSPVICDLLRKFHQFHLIVAAAMEHVLLA